MRRLQKVSVIQILMYSEKTLQGVLLLGTRIYKFYNMSTFKEAYSVLRGYYMGPSARISVGQLVVYTCCLHYQISIAKLIGIIMEMWIRSFDLFY